MSGEQEEAREDAIHFASRPIAETSKSLGSIGSLRMQNHTAGVVLETKLHIAHPRPHVHTLEQVKQLRPIREFEYHTTDTGMEILFASTESRTCARLPAHDCSRHMATWEVGFTSPQQ